MAELKDNINQMIANLRDTTQRNQEQDWLKTNLARISGLMQGQRVLATVAQLIMSELTPSITAQHGAFFMAESGDDGERGSCGSSPATATPAATRCPTASPWARALVGQAALERRTIEIDDAARRLHPRQLRAGPVDPGQHRDHADPLRGPGPGRHRAGVAAPPSAIHRTFLEQLMETLGVVLNTIIANMRTEELLQQSQQLNAGAAAAAGSSGAGGEGAPLACRTRHRGQEPRDRAGASRPGGEGPSWPSPAATSPSSWPT